MKRIVALALVLAVGCSAGPDRTAVVSVLASNAIVPTIEDASNLLNQLSDSVEVFCTSPSTDTLEAARDSWSRAKPMWEMTDIATFYGPADTQRTVSKVDFEPVSYEGIEELLDSDADLTVDYVGNRSAASRRGLGTIEYLLFADLETAGDQRRCQLARSAAMVAADAGQELVGGWTDPDMGWVLEMTMDMDANAAIADVVGAQVEILKRLTLFELGVALGVTASEPRLEALPEGTASMGATRIDGQLAGIETTLKTGGESSLIELIRSRSDEVATEIESHLAAGRAILASVEGPIREAVVDHPETMSQLLDELTPLRDLIEVDVVSLLDLTLGFSDSDGDSG